MYESAPPPPHGRKLQCYIVRQPGDVLVPLIPVDQLPLQLQAVPRQLSHREVVEGGWKFVGETAEPARLFDIRKRPDPYTAPLTPKFRAPDYGVRGDLSISRRAEQDARYPRAARPLSAPAYTPDMSGDDYHLAQLLHQLTPRSPTHQDPPRSAPNPLPPSGIPPAPEKKEYCTHWIKTGECSFMAVGCKYKHEIPPLAKLRELGFFAVPRWYKERAALQITPTWLQRQAEARKEGAELEPPPQDANPYLSRWKPDREDGGEDEKKEASEDDASDDESNHRREHPTNVDTWPPSIPSDTPATGNILPPAPPPSPVTVPAPPPPLARPKARLEGSKIPTAKPAQPAPEPRPEPTRSADDEPPIAALLRSRPRSSTKKPSKSTSGRAPAPATVLVRHPVSAPAALPPRTPRGLAKSQHAEDDMETEWLKKIAELPPPLALVERGGPPRVETWSAAAQVRRPRRSERTGTSGEQRGERVEDERGGAQNEILIDLLGE